uniref:Uncharacterized protein n=1 Tax=Anguilla anguilla TaxID=7936 RepID=A0A0E9S4U5_ANGAN
MYLFRKGKEVFLVRLRSGNLASDTKVQSFIHGDEP